MANAGIYNLANQPTVPLQNPQDMALKRMSYETAKQQFEDQRAKRTAQEEAKGLWKEAGGDFRKAQALATERGLMDHAGYFGEIADKHDTELAKAKEAASKMSIEQRKDVFDRVQTVGKFSKWVLSQAPEKQQEAFELGISQLGQHIPELQQMQGKFDPNHLALLGSQMDAYAGALADEKPMTDLGKLNWELRRGMITQDQYNAAVRKATTHAPGVNVQMGEKLQPGWRIDPENPNRWIPIPGGPYDKLPEKQNSMVVGTQNLQAAIKEYQDVLGRWGATDALSPSRSAEMGIVYNNMLLQAKEAYNLGVLSGPDYEILQKVITDPRSLKGTITPNSALQSQASTLARIMGNVGQTASQVSPRTNKAPEKPKDPTGPKATDAKGNKVMWNGSAWVPVK